MFDITCSIVVYKTEVDKLKKAIQSFLDTSLNVKLFIIDNSPDNRLNEITASQPKMEYIHNKENVGFGKAHNQVCSKIINKSKYHVVLNPDIYFNPGTLESIYNFMETVPAVGLAMPRIILPDGSLQYLCRLLPTPFDFLLRRLNLPLSLHRRFFKYELKFKQHDNIIYAPYLSGCFMFIRNEVLQKVGIFDERFFMYFEDVDLSRRIHEYYKTAYYPEAVVYHAYDGGSCKNPNLTRYFIYSAIKYFNKWGWFFDKERTLINRQVLSQLENIK